MGDNKCPDCGKHHPDEPGSPEVIGFANEVSRLVAQAMSITRDGKSLFKYSHVTQMVGYMVLAHAFAKYLSLPAHEFPQLAEYVQRNYHSDATEPPQSN